MTAEIRWSERVVEHREGLRDWDDVGSTRPDSLTRQGMLPSGEDLKALETLLAYNAADAVCHGIHVVL